MTYEYGFWGLLLLTVVKELLIPILNKIMPAKVQAGIDAQKRHDDAEGQKDKLERELINATVTGSERLNAFEKMLIEYGRGHDMIVANQNRILDALQISVRGIEVLLDRKNIQSKRKPNPK